MSLSLNILIVLSSRIYSCRSVGMIPFEYATYIRWQDLYNNKVLKDLIV